MRKSRSGSRSGTKKPTSTTKFRYEIVRFNEHGELYDLSEQELEGFKSKHPQFAAQWLSPQQEDTTEATWQSLCGRMFEGLMQSKAALWFLAPVNPAQLVPQHGQSGRLGGAIAGHYGHPRLHLKA